MYKEDTDSEPGTKESQYVPEEEEDIEEEKKEVKQPPQKRKNKLFNNLKVVPATFYQIFIFPPNDSPLKTMKNAFSSKKLFSFLRYSNFSFPQFPDSKGQMEVE